MNPSAENAFDLERFVTAQRDTYDGALQELRNGQKRSHWMWFIFPQVAGLSSSAMAKRYAVQSRREAEAYLAHPVLGQRLIACTKALLQVNGKTAEDVMGYPDCLKLKSSMTLFAAVSAPDSPFQKVLERYYSGELDVQTIEFLGSHA